MIRSDEKDDTISIAKDLATNEFVVTFTDENDGDPVVHKMSGLYQAKVLDYVYMLLKNQYLDEEGFDKVQVNIPAMPRMIVSGSKFSDIYYRQHFYELIGFGLDNLENAAKVCTTPRRVASVPRVPVAPARPCSAQYTQYQNVMNPEEYEEGECCAPQCGYRSGSPRRHMFFDE
jgi:hypothetical protein